MTDLEARGRRAAESVRQALATGTERPAVAALRRRSRRRRIVPATGAVAVALLVLVSLTDQSWRQRIQTGTGSTTLSTSPSSSGALSTTTSSSSAVRGASCSADDLAVTADTDRSSYATGQLVTITAVAQNRAAHPCVLPDAISVEFVDPAGLGLEEHAVEFVRVAGAVWSSGQIIRQGFSWDQKACIATPGYQEGVRGSSCQTRKRVPPGRYAAVVRVSVGSTVRALATARFSIS